MSNIRLMLVDDHDIVRTGLKTYLEAQDGIQVVAEARDGIEAVERALEMKPDIVLMDISMPRMDGIEATRRLSSLLAGCQVLALTIHEEKKYLLEMLAAGAAGYITKQAPTADLLAAIWMVSQGQFYLPPLQARWLVEEYNRLSNLRNMAEPAPKPLSREQEQLGSLSERERQVLELITLGESNQQIGNHLGISHKTVARHRERIMDKLGLHSCTELVKFAIRSGLVRMD